MINPPVSIKLLRFFIGLLIIATVGNRSGMYIGYTPVKMIFMG